MPSEMKKFYSVKELSSLNLSSLPSAHKNILAKAERENWVSRKRQGRGGGVEYDFASFSTELQDEITHRVLSTPKELTVKVNRKVAVKVDVEDLTQHQRDIADARMALVQVVLGLEETLSRISSITKLVDGAKAGTLSDDIMMLIEVANAKKGAKRTVSVRTLNSWVIAYHKAKKVDERMKALAPAVRKQKKAIEIAWLPDFLATYRNTNGHCVAEAYELFAQKWLAEREGQPYLQQQLPSLSAVQRGLKKLPRNIKEIGRKTGAELRALNTYVKRDWSVLRANDVWVGDGHAMKFKVAHPDHGRPFIPELTLVIDAASRFVVGWSVSLAENVLAVADAIRYGVKRYGIPAIYYSDNGGGQKNWVLDAPITGMLPRLGINHQTGIPGNPQGRGIIERLNRTLALRIARNFETYHGAGADRETVRKVSTGVISLDKALRKGKGDELTPVQKKAQGKLPSWKQFIDAIEAGVEWYNRVHVHSEIGMTPAQKRAEILREEDIVYITAVEERDMFRPQVQRVAQRGWISLFNNDYFNEQLINVDGEKVSVSFDIHDASSVIVRDLDGRYICDGILNGNKHAAFPETFVEKTRRERHQRRIKLKEEQISEINAELNPVHEIEHNDVDFLSQLNQRTIDQGQEAVNIFAEPKESKKIKPLFATLAEKEAWEQENN